MNEATIYATEKPFTETHPRREWVWMAVTVLGLLVVYASPLREHLSHLNNIRDDLLSVGPWAPALFLVATMALSALGTPRTLFYPIAGWVFGFGIGLSLALCGTLLGAYGTFVYARWAGREAVINRWPAMTRFSQKLEGRGILTVAFLRQLPGPAIITNLVLGLSPISHRAFFIGTGLGIMPSAIPATLIGTSLSQPSSSLRSLTLALSVASMIVLWLLFTAYTIPYIRRRDSNRSG